MISVVIPVLNEAKALPFTLAALQAQGGSFEVIVVDGGSDDGTAALAAEHPGVRVLQTQCGRACQMNAGAAAARGEVLLFLHADTRLPPGALAALETPGAPEAGAFRHRFIPSDWRLRLLSHGNNLRCRISRIYFGDQAIFVRRSVFEHVGGFPDVPFLEDVMFCERLRACARAVLLREAVHTDSRRFLHHGVWRTIGRGLWLYTLHRLGFAPAGKGYTDVVR
jgi:rSAM/selenodomain-associated transferase 2